MSREAPRFLVFSTTAVYSFVFAVWGCDRICLSIRENYLLVLSTATIQHYNRRALRDSTNTKDMVIEHAQKRVVP